MSDELGRNHFFYAKTSTYKNLATPTRGRPPKKKGRTRTNTMSPPRCAAKRPRKGLNIGGLEETPLHQIASSNNRRTALQKQHIRQIEERMEKVINDYMKRPWLSEKKTEPSRRRSSGYNFFVYKFYY